MFSQKFLKKTLAILLLGTSIHTQIYAAPITWIGQSSNDLNLASNWSPATVPTTGDDAIFDSTIPGINVNPVGQGVDFSCSNFQFPFDAFPFNITIENHQLIFDGFGIIGSNTDATVNSNNTDNTTAVVSNQIFFNGPLSTSNSATVVANNTSTIIGSPPATSSCIIDRQIYSPNTFLVSDGGSLTASNFGTDASTGAGGNIAAGVYQGQAIFGNRCILADFVRMTVINNGLSTSPSANNFAGYVREWQLHSVDDFIAGEGFNLFVANAGVNNTAGAGGQNLGIIDSVSGMTGSQIEMNGEWRVRNFANILVLNSGFVQGTNTTDPLNVGTMVNEQVRIHGAFESRDFLNMNVFNEGRDSSQGVGGNNVGVVPATQLRFDSRVETEDNSTIILVNFGSNTGTTSSQGNKIGYVDQDQLNVSGIFRAGDNFNLNVSNEGNSSCISAGVDEVGKVSSGLQVCFSDECMLGDNALIFVSNKGTYTGNSPTSTFTGYVFDDQACFENLLTAGKNFNLQISNEGIANTVGNGNFVGVTTTQFDLDQGCLLGDDAVILITNKGTNSNATGINNQVGYVNGNQAFVNEFTAGKNLEFSVTNSANNTGNASNSVGYIGGSQIVFSGDVNFNDNSLVLVSNSGRIVDSQMVFQNGFNILSGKATLQAINSGTVGFKGIYVQDGLGGNANIVLSNASFYVDTTLPTFTIGELNGDTSSTAQSRPELIINTDSLTNGDFAGSIQNFPSTVSMLTKTGPGTQKLSGVNTYTGLTKVNEGILILTGSVAGDVNVNLSGILKGTGTIGGNLVNFGTVAPGESIGTLHVLGDYVNNSGTYDVEVNGQGQSDLIDVSGNVMLNGGIVAVSSVDGRYNFQKPYTIVIADGDVSGTYTGATASGFIKPILTYDPHHVYLTIMSDLLKAAKTCNQFGVAGSLDNLLNPNDAQSLVINEIVNLPLDKAQMSLESFSGFQYTQDVWMTEIATRRFLRHLYDPLRSLVSDCGSCIPCSEWTAWLETGGSFTNLRGKNAHKMNVNSFEVTGGVQKTFCYDLTFGLAGSYEHDQVKYRNGHANRNSEFIAAYGLYKPCMFYGLADLVYGHTSNRVSRTMHAGDLHFKAHSKPNLNTFAFYGEMGFDLNNEYFLIQPFLGVQAGKSRRNHINENFADGWGLSINKRDWSSVSSRLGFHLSQCNLCECINTTLDIAWNYLWSEHNNSTKGRFRHFGEAFSICGNNLDRNSFDYALNFQTCLCDDLEAYLELGGELWSRAHTFDVIAGIKFSW